MKFAFVIPCTGIVITTDPYIEECIDQANAAALQVGSRAGVEAMGGDVTLAKDLFCKTYLEMVHGASGNQTASKH